MTSASVPPEGLEGAAPQKPKASIGRLIVAIVFFGALIVLSGYFSSSGILPLPLARLSVVVVAPLIFFAALWIFGRRRSGETKPQAVTKRKNPAMTGSTALSPVACMLFLYAAAPFVNPFDFGYNFSKFLLFCLPLGAVALFLLCQNPNWPYKPSEQQPDGMTIPRLWPYRVIACGVLTGIFAMVGLGLNQWLDTSTGTPQRYIAIKAYANYAPKGGTSYYVTMVRDTATGLRQTMDLHVNEHDYDLVKQNKAVAVTLMTHPGVLDMPWYEYDYAFTPDASPKPTR